MRGATNGPHGLADVVDVEDLVDLVDVFDYGTAALRKERRAARSPWTIASHASRCRNFSARSHPSAPAIRYATRATAPAPPYSKRIIRRVSKIIISARVSVHPVL